MCSTGARQDALRRSGRRRYQLDGVVNFSFTLHNVYYRLYRNLGIGCKSLIGDIAHGIMLPVGSYSKPIIEPAMSFFKKLEIPKKFAPYVETIYMDGGNDVYMNIIPQWDGEDETFDLNEITLTELQQFPNLKKATVMSSNLDEVKEIFDAANIEVKLL